MDNEKCVLFGKYDDKYDMCRIWCLVRNECKKETEKKGDGGMGLKTITENHYMFNDEGTVYCDMRGGPDICTENNCKKCYYLLEEYRKLKRS